LEGLGFEEQRRARPLQKGETESGVPSDSTKGDRYVPVEMLGGNGAVSSR
jgi:hypothetical protein